ncbi:unnamed protein product [Rotaria socialis]|uniref:Carbonic anhydrase n=1 Tax=Rotaria socialis TaxID=392032 RepID=A0A821HDK1_9BILA|nr:unnamed protein product [Rotaria socialis]CAF3549632.1 unnamed protein product [Rotaria socialis]CAF4302836.1 unnamed protein product [Rotaria socialis]CAF4682454.1 unnamed protein product [Rotaria socialis]
MLQLILTTLLFLPTIVEASGIWSYENIKQWRRGNRYCAGNLQSPIDLRFNRSTFDSRLKQVYLEDRYPPEQAEIVNSGHTAQLNLKNHFVLKNIAPGSEDYKVEQIHFHWGHANNDNNGSEHLLEGQAYPLEMHMVTYSSWYSNIKDAMTNTRGLAVVGVFFELSTEPNPFLQPVVDALAHIRSEHQHTPVRKEFNLKALIGEDRMARYYRYDGSLTTPPCYESVIWTVLLDPLQISFQQLHAFRYLHDAQAHVIANTYRPVQKIGTRKLFRSFHLQDIHEDKIRRLIMKENHGQCLTLNMKLIAIFICLLTIAQ